MASLVPFARFRRASRCDEFEGGDGAAFRSHHGIAPDRPVMLLVGRVAHEKNIGFLLRVLAEVRRSVPNVLFIIAGEGPALAAVQREAGRDGLARKHAVRRLFGPARRAARLLPRGRRLRLRVADRDQGLVLLESLALGVPVVSTAVLGTKEVLRNAAGAIVVAEDVTEFAAAVVKILTKSQLRAAARRRRPRVRRAVLVEPGDGEALGGALRRDRGRPVADGGVGDRRHVAVPE